VALPYLRGIGSVEQISGVNEQIPERGQTYLSGIGPKVMWEKQKNQHTSPTTAE
jgi:hypothetical protein